MNLFLRCLIFFAAFAFLNGCSGLQTQGEKNAGVILYEKAFYAESVEHDFKKAHDLYVLSAEQGNPWAKNNLRNIDARENMPSQYIVFEKNTSHYEKTTYLDSASNQLNYPYLQTNQVSRKPNISNAVLYQDVPYESNVTILPEVMVTAKQIDQCHARADIKAEKYADLKSKAVISNAEKVSAITGGATGLGCLGLVALTMGLDGGLLAAGCVAVGALSGAAHNYTNSDAIIEEAERVREQTLVATQERLYRECGV